MIDIRLYYNTVRYLRLKQVLFQISRRIWKNFRCRNKRFDKPRDGRKIVLLPFITKPVCYDSGTECFDFLNLKGQFSGDWDYDGFGDLWTYNLNYMDYLLQSSIDPLEAKEWIFRFIEGLPKNRCAYEPYPIALRGINWIKFAAVNRNIFTSGQQRAFDTSLYTQYMRLARNPEFHLLGNHLLEDGYSLLWGAIYFGDLYFYKRACRILRKELEEQILDDGAHFELSPMYHSILTDRLLDCINISRNNPVFATQKELDCFLICKVRKMLGWLDAVVYEDHAIPLLNDSAYDIAPSYAEIVEYAKRLGIEWSAETLCRCGYRKYSGRRYECIVDIGPIGAPYIPGHAHADTFSFELRADRKPFIVDTGISTYNKNARRQYERSTMAHNTVTIGDRDSSRVWGGFRCAERAEVTIHTDTSTFVRASHNGYKRRTVSRSFEFFESELHVRDSISGGTVGIGRLHLAPEVKVLTVEKNSICTSLGMILIDNADEIWTEACSISRSYNLLEPSVCVCYRFSGTASLCVVMNINK